MLLGWWGFISSIITPFILLNNLFRFIFCTGMRKPPLQIAPSPSPFWIFSTIGGFLLIGFSLFSIISFASAQPAYSPPPTTVPIISTQSAYSPPQTTVPQMTARIPVKTPTALKSACIRWNLITPTMNDRIVCVYGTVYSIYSTGEAATRIKFTTQPYTFFIYDANYTYPDLKEGDCVAAEEVVKLFDNTIPYMSISDLYHCESWMK